MAAVRYRTESKRLVLGLLVADPWAGRGPFGVGPHGEGRLVAALYAGARGLAAQAGPRRSSLRRTSPPTLGVGTSCAKPVTGGAPAAGSGVRLRRPLLPGTRVGKPPGSRPTEKRG